MGQQNQSTFILTNTHCLILLLEKTGSNSLNHFDYYLLFFSNKTLYILFALNIITNKVATRKRANIQL